MTMRASNGSAGAVDRIATLTTAAVAALILAMVALTARSATTHAKLAATTVAMAYPVGPLIAKVIGRISARSQTGL
jgi:hypothetical protein